MLLSELFIADHELLRCLHIGQLQQGSELGLDLEGSGKCLLIVGGKISNDIVARIEQFFKSRTELKFAISSGVRPRPKYVEGDGFNFSKNCNWVSFFASIEKFSVNLSQVKELSLTVNVQGVRIHPLIK